MSIPQPATCDISTAMEHHQENSHQSSNLEQSLTSKLGGHLAGGHSSRKAEACPSWVDAGEEESLTVTARPGGGPTAGVISFQRGIEVDKKIYLRS